MCTVFIRAFSIIFFCALCSVAEAVPSYARNLGLDCSVCHTVYPQLTEFGKLFLETGGDLLIQKKYGAMTLTPEVVSGRAQLRPIDKRFSSDSRTALTKGQKQLKMRSLHEANLYLSGRVGKIFVFTEFAAEDEWGDAGREGFDCRLEEGFAMYRMCDNFSIFAGYDSPFTVDGNDTVKHHNVLARQWKAAQYTPETSQMIGVSAICGQFSWIAAWHGAADVTEGNDPRSISLRGVLDCHHKTFGAYFSHGYLYDGVREQSLDPYYEYGVDSHLRYNDTNVLMLLGFRKKHNSKTDFDFSIEANKLYLIKNSCINRFLTSFYPIGNLDFFVDRQESSGAWIQGGAGIAFYINPAVRIFPQIEGTLRAPSEYKHKELRFVISADIGL